MSGKLQKEIGKTGPFASLEEEATLNLLRTADRLMGFCEAALKSTGLTPTQYNVLRILRGVSPQGVACQEIAPNDHPRCRSYPAPGPARITRICVPGTANR